MRVQELTKQELKKFSCDMDGVYNLTNIMYQYFNGSVWPPAALLGEAVRRLRSG